MSVATKEKLYSVVRFRSLSDSGLDAEMQHDFALVVDPVYAQVTCHPQVFLLTIHEHRDDSQDLLVVAHAELE